MPHCMVTGRTNGSKKTKGILVSYHRLPQEKKMRKIWLNRVRRDNPPQYKSCYVCSMHFTSDCFETSLMESFGMKSKARLKEESIPSIFPFQEQKNERLSSQSRLQKRNSSEKKAETEKVCFLSFYRAT